MRIGIEAQRIQRRKKHGMDIVAVETIRHLQAIDHVNEYFIFVKPDEDKNVIKETANFHLVEIPSSPYPYWEQVLLPRFARKHGVDLLHCTSNTAPMFLSMPLVVTIHDIIYLEKLHFSQGTWYQRMGNIYRRLNVPFIFSKADKVLTVSNFEQKNILDHFDAPESFVQTVYNAASEHFKPVSDRQLLEEFRIKYQLPERFIFFLGNTDPKKNVKGVLKAYARFLEKSADKIPLVMPDLDKDFLQNALKETNYPDLAKHIVLTGYIPNKELPYVYNLAEIFIYPSLRESFGIPLVEAMACGVPVITSNTSSMPEIAGGAALLADPYNVEEMALKIEELINDKALREKLTAEGLRRAEFFSWKHTAQQVKTVYETIYQENES